MTTIVAISDNWSYKSIIGNRNKIKIKDWCEKRATQEHMKGMK